MRLARGVILSAVAALALGCGGEEETKDTIKIGVIHTITGPSANPRNLEAVLLAVDEINALGGVNGAPLEVESRDDATNVDSAKAAASELVDLKVPVVIGPINSTRFLAASEVLVPAKTVQIGGAATSPALTTLADDGYVFRTVTADSAQGSLVAKRAKAQGFSRVAVLHLDSVYGNGLAGAFRTAFEAGGGTVTSQIALAESQTSYQAELTSAFSVDPAPQALFLIAALREGAPLLKDYNASFLGTGTFIYLCDAMADPNLVSLLGPGNFTFQHEAFTSGKPSTPQYNSFKRAFSDKYGSEPAGNTANFYDATYLAALALHAAKSSDPTAVRDQLPGVSGAPGTLYGASAYAAAIQDLTDGKDIDYDGASGNVDFDANGDVYGGYAVLKVVNGTYQTIESYVVP